MLRKFTSKIILYLNIAAAICLLIATVAPLINPARILFPAFFGLAYPYFLILNIVFLAFWIIRFNKYLLVSLITILLGWNHMMNLFPLNLNKSNTEISEEVQTVKLLSYNVRAFDQFRWTNKENTRNEIFDLFSKKQPDILCMQEFYTSPRKGYGEKDVVQQLKHYPHYAVYYSKKTSHNTGAGIATFSKYPILKTSRIPFSNTTNKAIYTDIKVNTDTVRVFNIHLQSIKFGQSTYSFMDTLSLKYSNEQLEGVKAIGSQLRTAFVQRAEQSVVISRYIEESPYPVILMGDFNDTPVSYAYKKIKKGLKDAFRQSGRGLGNTYAGELPSFRIDFILYSHELEAQSFNRIKSKYSDHFPITSTLFFKNDVLSED